MVASGGKYEMGGKEGSGVMKEKRVYSQIIRLVAYGLETNLIVEQDIVYVVNQLMELFEIEEPDEDASLESYRSVKDESNLSGRLENILNNMLNYACERGIITEDNITHRDLFDTKVMGVLVSRPSEVSRNFYKCYKVSPVDATKYYYKLSGDSNYIRRYRIEKDIKWVTSTEYGDLDITINLSKPEKDPKEIAAAKEMKQTGYPLCLLCRENEGYAGRINHPARQNHRVIPITLDGEQWFMQYSPYVYYNEHCIVFSEKHEPMTINSSTFRKLAEFVNMFPHYTIGSNADLPIVGGSILTHEHFQGGNYEFAMAKAPVEKSFTVKGYEGVEAGIVKWPMSVIRISSVDCEKLIGLAAHILEKWISYTDEECFIYAQTDGHRHNTITPIARMRGERIELDMVLRNNITTKECPLGVFHPHDNLHHIKKENIGLIEVMGLAVLPARLEEELRLIKEAIRDERDIDKEESIRKHAEWVREIREKYTDISSDNIEDILRHEVGMVFLKVLEDAGVFKRNQKGMKGFMRFVEELTVCQKLQ